MCIFLKPEKPFLLIMENSSKETIIYWCETEDEMNEVKIEAERINHFTIIDAIEIGSYREVKLKDFKEGDRVYHKNLKLCGTFVDYAWESDEECDVDFEMEDGEIEQKHVSVNQIVIIDNLKNMKSCETCGCKEDSYCNNCEEYNKWFFREENQLMFGDD